MSGRRTLHDLNGNGVPDKLEKHHGFTSGQKSSDLNRNGIPDKYESGRATFNTDLNQNGIPDRYEGMTIGTTHRSDVLLPTKVIQKPAAIHEEIRREQVEEIQPIVNVEKIKTEVHQVTQPLIDREVRALGVSERMLPTQVLPQINQPTVAMRSAQDVSTVSYREQSNMVIEKPAIYMETDRKQIIEEIQPVIYKETIVPTLIKETRPIYQTVVEGTTFVHQTLPAQQLKTSVWSGKSWATDLNANGIPDQFERGTTTNFVQSNDLNRNGIPDQLERGNSSAFTHSNDLNRNGIPDQLERGSNWKSTDLNQNGIPDGMERKMAPTQAPNATFTTMRTM